MPKRNLLLIVGIIFTIFVFFSFLTAQELFTQWDFDTMVQLQDNLPALVDFPFSLISVIGSAEITTTLWFLLVIYSLFKRLVLATLSLMLFPLSVLIELFGKIVLLHPAPPHFFYRGVIQFDFPSHFVHTQYSYPSGHVTRLTFLLTVGLIYLLNHLPKKWQIPLQFVLITLFLSVCISRVYLGEHWPTDVIGGSLLGSSLGLIAGLTLFTRQSQKISSE